VAISRVQSTIKQAASASPWTMNYATQATAAGSLLVLMLAAWGGGAAASAVSDPVNGAWTQLGGTATQTNANLQIWYRLNAASLTTAQSVSVTSTGGDKGGVLIEYSGAATSSATDPASYTTTTGNGTAAASTSVVTGSITTGTANDVYIAGVAGDGVTSTWTAPSSPWGFVQQSGDATFISIAVEDRINNDAAGTFSQTIANNVSENKAAKIGAFVPPSGPLPPVGISPGTPTWGFPHPPLSGA
jgi:hypothetical protein